VHNLFNDWVTLLVELQHPKLDGGALTRTKQGGEIQFQKDLNISLNGSWESRLQIGSYFSHELFKHRKIATHLLIHGNVTKFMQGHSVFGSSDFITPVVSAVKKIIKILELKPNDLEMAKIKKGDIEITRVDITNMTRLNNNVDVEIYLRKYAGTATFRGKRVEVVGDTINHWGTNYIQKTSKRWTFKNYNKYNDLLNGPLDHRIPDYVIHKDLLIKHCEGMVRNELTLRKTELRKIGIEKLNQLTAETVKTQFEKYRGKILLADNIELSHEQVLNMPRHLQHTYLLWMSGKDVRYSFNTLRTYQRHRKQLIEQYNIDINTLVERQVNNVVPMVRILEAKPEPLPEWADELGLVHHG
jgi:II/X family phage/plasmid replication protein